MPHDPLIFTTYERFLLSEYNVEAKGLYYKLGEYFIYCPLTTETTPSTDSQYNTIHEWLKDHRMLCQWISVVNIVPDNAVRIDDNVDNSKPSDSRYLVTQSDIDYEIELLIPTIFPDYEIAAYNPTVIVNFLSPITDEGKMELERIFSASQFPIPVSFTDQPNSSPLEPIEPLFKHTTTFRKSKKNLSGGLYAAIEKDEDDWVSNRMDILNGESKKDLRPKAFQSKKSRGFVDGSIAAPDNMRNYLSLFNEIAIVPPNKEKTESFFKGLGVTNDEFLGLIEIGKVHLLLPNSIDEYELELVECALERKQNNVHFTRCINGFTMQEIRKRNPLFFPSISVLEKQTLLRAVDQSLTFLNPDDKKIAQNLIAELGHGWVSIPNAMNEMNVHYISQFSIVNILDAIIKHHTKKDFKMELMVAAPMVELAASTGSVLMPTSEPAFDLSPFCEVLANFYSGVPNDSLVIPKPAFANFAIEEILAISQHVPILEFAKTFEGAEVNRFRALIVDIANSSSTPQDVESTIEAFNYFVRQYEKNSKDISQWNIKGFVLNQLGGGAGIPYGAWILKTLTNTVQKYGTKFEKAGRILDSIEATIVGTYPDAVLVSRMRDKIKKKI